MFAEIKRRQSSWHTRFGVVIVAVASAACLVVYSVGSSVAVAKTASAAAAGTAASQVAAANAEVKKLSKPAETIGVTMPLKSKPPTGKTVVYLRCLLPQCTTEYDGAAAAAAAIGWHIKAISYDSANPAQLVAGMTTALQYKPAAVINSGLPESQFASVIPAYTKARVPIVMLDTGPQKLPKIILANIYGPQDISLHGDAIAAWFVANSGAKGKALLVDVPGFPILHDIGAAFSSYVKAHCTACSVQTLSLTIPEVESNGLTSAITSALKRDSSVSYLIGEDGAFFDAIPSALSAAGLKVSVAAAWGDATTEAGLKTGQIGAVTGYAQAYQGWSAVDAILRHIEGMPLPSFSDGVDPTQLLTKADIKTPTNDYQLPANYTEQFKKLWHVG